MKLVTLEDRSGTLYDKNGQYVGLINAHNEGFELEKDSQVDIKDVIKLKESGFDADDIVKLKKEGVI